jgi:hypothetical protein
VLRGINYDTGFTGADGQNTRTDFDPDTVRRELTIIARDLHCDAVRISGGDPDRLTTAAHAALDAGLQVWYAPFPVDLTPDELDPYFTRCAQAAQQIHTRDPRTVLVLGCELTLFAKGFIPGDTLPDRITNATNPNAWATFHPTHHAPAVLTHLATTARRHYPGRLTYAAGEWEHPDWTAFDLVSVDLYRDTSNATDYPDRVRALHTHGKPVAITEFGCCTYTGAADKGGMGWAITDPDHPDTITGDHHRDETEQVRYFTELLDTFTTENITAAFWFTFASYGNTHHPDNPHHDLDLAAYGVVKILPDGTPGTRYPDHTWEPKLVFDTIATRYATQQTAQDSTGE